MSKLVISRKIWLRGRPDQSCLLNERGKRCCLGIYGQSLGISDELMRDASSPASRTAVSGFITKASWLLRGTSIGLANSEEATRLMRANDNAEITEKERETRVSEVFAKRGIQVVFED